MPVKAGASYSCNYHAYKDCIGNSVYWFDSCANPQDLVQNCSDVSQICKYGQCAVYYNPAPAPTYINHYRTSCYNNSLYWYDSLGNLQSLYKSCADVNQCTEDVCSGLKCQNPVKCDGVTCIIGSQDYCNNCSYTGDGACNCGETFATAPNDCKANASSLSDSVTISPNPNQAAAVSLTPTTSGFMEFLKRWYLWILVAIVLIFLFFVIFRRLSTNV